MLRCSSTIFFLSEFFQVDEQANELVQRWEWRLVPSDVFFGNTTNQFISDMIPGISVIRFLPNN
jgi:hypothetical protein